MKMTPMALIRRRFSNARASITSQNTTGNNENQNETEAKGSDLSSKTLKLSLSVQDQREIFMVKISECVVPLDFSLETVADIKARENKKCILMEVLAFVNDLNQRKQEASVFFSEELLRKLVVMISANLFRERDPILGFDPDEDEPVLDVQWPHKRVVYDLLLKVVISPGLVVKVAKKQGILDQCFLLRIIQEFESEDSRERDYLKTILHRLYGKFFTHRKFVRDQISQVFNITVDLNVRHPGIAELLEILASIINGLSLPLKQEHLDFLRDSLLPLHKLSYMEQFQHQLYFCMTKFVEKEKSLAAMIICYLYNVWPVSVSSKQLFFLVEVELILEVIHPITQCSTEEIDLFLPKLLEMISKSLISPHFQVAEKALSFWNNQTLTASAGLFGESYSKDVFPHILLGLQHNINAESRHWNEAVALLSERVLGIFKQSIGEDKFDKFVEEFILQEKEEARETRLMISSLLGKNEGGD